MDPSDSENQDSYPVNLTDMSVEEAKSMIDAAEDPTVCCAGGRNCLFYVVQRPIEKEALELAQFIVDHVASLTVETQDDFGQTPLFYAAREGHTSCLELLVSKCNLNASHVDNAQQTALFYAARDGRNEAVVWLVEIGGADINHVDGNGETPLFYAARDGREDTIQKMIELGADVSIKNKNKAFPATAARKNGNRKLAAELDNLRKQKEATHSGGSSSTRRSTAPTETKRRQNRRVQMTPPPRQARRKRPLREVEDAGTSAKRRSRAVRGSAEEADSACELEERAIEAADESQSNTGGAQLPSITLALTPKSSKTVSKRVSKDATEAALAKQTPHSTASSPAMSEDEVLSASVVKRESLSTSASSGKRGGKVSATVPLYPESTVQDFTSRATETRQTYQLQYLGPGKAWTFATPFKLEEFESLYPLLAVWDPTTDLPEIGLSNDPYRSKWHEQASELMLFLQGVEGAWLFEEPVDPAKWSINDYFDIVKNPMDFCTIRQRLSRGSYYRTVKSFIDDVELVFYNCILYNSGESDIGQLCSKIRGLYLNQSRRLGLADMLEAEERHEVISRQIVAKILSTGHDAGEVVARSQALLREKEPVIAHDIVEGCPHLKSSKELPRKTTGLDETIDQSSKENPFADFPVGCDAIDGLNSLSPSLPHSEAEANESDAYDAYGVGKEDGPLLTQSERMDIIGNLALELSEPVVAESGERNNMKDEESDCSLALETIWADSAGEVSAVRELSLIEDSVSDLLTDAPSGIVDGILESCEPNTENKGGELPFFHHSEDISEAEIEV